MAKVSFVKTKNGFVLHPDQEAEDVAAFTRLEEGTEHVLAIKKQRSSPFHRLMFKWFSVLFANQDQYADPNQMRYAYTARAGFISHQIVRMISRMATCPKCHHRYGIELEEHVMVPESLNYENCDQNRIEEIKNGIAAVAFEDGIDVPFDLRG